MVNRKTPIAIPRSAPGPVTMVISIVLFTAAFFSPEIAFSQATDTESAVSDPPREEKVGPANRGLGGQVLLLNSGLGLGFYVTRMVSPDVTLLAEISLSSIKDDREVAFFDRLGQKDVPNKANYVFQIPVQFGVERRLFRASIEDNFRPFFHVVTGPSFVWRSPYFDDVNNNGELDTDERIFSSFQSLSKGSLEMGWSGTISLGAHFGKLYGGSQSLRVGYTFTYFFNEIPLLEPSVRAPARWVGSPTIRLSFGKLY